MRYLKTFESLNINEGQDMMFMPVDPIAKTGEVYGEIFQSLLDKLKSITDFNKLVEELKKNPEEAKKLAKGLKDEEYNYTDHSGWDEKKITSTEYWIDKLKSWGCGALFIGLFLCILIAVPVANGEVAPTTLEIIYAALFAGGFGGALGDAALSYVRRTKK